MLNFLVSPHRNRAATALLVTLAVLLTALAGLELTRESGRIACIWLANGVLVAVLLKTPSRSWVLWLACGLAGNLGADLIAGDASRLALLLSLSNTLEVVLVAGLFRWLRPEAQPNLARLGSLLVFLALAGVAGPGLSALGAAWLLGAQGLPVWTVFRTWFAADALGLLIIVPLLAEVGWREPGHLIRSRAGLALLPVLVAVPCAGFTISHGGHFAWIFLLSPLFLWAVTQSGFKGVALTIFLATASGIAGLSLAARHGQAGQMREHIAFLQLFLFTNVLIFLPVASLLASLRESVANFRALFEKAPIGMAIVDSTSGRFLEVNPRLGEILGYGSGELLGTTFKALTDPEQAARDEASVAELAAGLVTEIQKEKPYRHRSGRTVWGRLKMVAMPESPAYPRRHFSLVEDITEAHLAREALEESEARFRAIIEHSRDAMGVAKADRLVMVNPAFVAMFGYPDADAMLGRSIPDFITPEAREAMRARIQDRVSGTRRPTFYEVLGLRQDGSTFALEVQETTFTLAGETLTLGLLRDITERRVAEAERLRLQTQLHHSQKLESLGSLAGGVAHEMNNVLGAILALASTRMRVEPADGQTFEALATIREAATRGGEVVKSLLQFARHTPHERRNLDLNTLFGDVIRLLERTTLARVRIVTRFEPALPRIQGNPAELIHAIMNLCINAVDAMGGGGTLTLSTRALGEGQVEACVADTGPGMSPEVLSRALDPFFTTKEVGKGTGLGLSLVYTTVKAHQGELQLASEGQGAQVRIRFPVSQVPDADPAEAVAPLERAAATLHVLIIDDDTLIQKATAMLLGLLGHTVTQAGTGEEGLALLEQGARPDLVILDMNMPGLGGKGTLAPLRALCPRVPILLATGRADQEAMDLVAAHPGVTLMPKPYTLEDLQPHLEAVPTNGTA